MATEAELFILARAEIHPGYVNTGKKGTMLPGSEAVMATFGIKECTCGCGHQWIFDHDERYLGAELVWPHEVILLSAIEQLGARYGGG